MSFRVFDASDSVIKSVIPGREEILFRVVCNEVERVLSSRPFVVYSKGLSENGRTVVYRRFDVGGKTFAMISVADGRVSLRVKRHDGPWYWRREYFHNLTLSFLSNGNVSCQVGDVVMQGSLRSFIPTVWNHLN